VVDLPEYVYLVTVDGEWPVSAIADDHPSIAEIVESEVERRVGTIGDLNYRRRRVHVWKARLVDAVEVDLMPATTVRASLRERPDHG
jgi:hypothetical protein